MSQEFKQGGISSYMDENLAPSPTVREARPNSVPSEKGATPEPGHQTTQKCLCFLEPNGKTLVVCIDGTGNQFSRRNTNVVELYSRLVKDKKQLTYYDSGIGTYVKPSWTSPSYWLQLADHSIDMAIAWHFRRIVLSAYQWLSENYEPGDRIFLFGFSRGAYQVRVIAGMIEKVGLLHKGNNNQIPFAYELYIATTAQKGRDKARQPNHRAEDSENPWTLCESFKNTLSQKDAKVHFVGAWDTVSSIGIARGPNLPETTTGMTHVCFFRHALALDERRVKFSPEYANGGAGTSPPQADNGDVKEVWFAGTHSDIGGGNAANLRLNHFGPSLRWMTYEAIQHGLKMMPYEGEWSAVELKESLTGLWKVFEYIPFLRLAYTDTESTTRQLHRGCPREVKHGQKVHQSVFSDHMGVGGVVYPQTTIVPQSPQASNNKDNTSERNLILFLLIIVGIPLDVVMRQSFPTFYSRSMDFSALFLTVGLLNVVSKELQEYSPAGKLVLFMTIPIVMLMRGSLPTFYSMSMTIWTLMLLYAPLSGLLSALQTGQPEKPYNLKYTPKAHIDIDGVTWDNLNGESEMIEKDTFADASRFLSRMKNGEPLVASSDDLHLLQGLATYSGLRSVTEFPDAIGILINYLEAEQDQQSNVMTVLVRMLGAFPSLPNDFIAKYPSSRLRELIKRLCESHVPKSSISKFAKLFDREKVIYGHYCPVQSVAFSPDGRQIVSGSHDWTVRIWDAETGRVASNLLQGHKNLVCAASFSPDGKRVVSGSWDCQIRLWDVGTGMMIGEPLEGHTNCVEAVAFSPDGSRIVSAGRDGTIRVWDVITRKMAGGPLIGHANAVWSIAVSPDSTRLASGAADCTIRLWDLETGQTIGDPLMGHGRGIGAISFSPDGKRIVSGSEDFTILIWNAETRMMDGGPLLGHSNIVRSVAFSPDGTRIASGSYDMTIRIWDVGTRTMVCEPLVGHTSGVMSVAFSPDGNRIVSGSHDGTIRIWDLEPKEIIRDLAEH